jgi:hypothetical protein
MAVCLAVTFEVRHTRGIAVPFLGHTLDPALANSPLRTLKTPACLWQTGVLVLAYELERGAYMS